MFDVLLILINDGAGEQSQDNKGTGIQFFNGLVLPF